MKKMKKMKEMKKTKKMKKMKKMKEMFGEQTLSSDKSYPIIKIIE